MATFLLEVGSEELPASFVPQALAQWQSRVLADLQDQALTPSALHLYGTPRRLALLLEGLPDRQPDRTEAVKGPSAQAAFKDGQPTAAATGFARSRGVGVEALEIRDTEKGAFVFVTQTLPGQALAQVLQERVPGWITGLEGKRFMRWGDGDLRFPRPIRWLVALLEDQVLPLHLENGSDTCQSDRTSQGHRVLSPGPLPLVRAQDYAETLRAAQVEVDPNRRRQTIAAQVEAAAHQMGGEALIPTDLLAEVTHLVEWPTAVVGQFEASFLDLPPEVAIMEMQSHQRYFPVRQPGSELALMPYFITIANGDPAKSALIAEGNARVIRARLSDGKFFFDADRRQSLESLGGRLATVTFEERLGSMAAKVERMGAIAAQIANQLQLDSPQQALIQRAIQLCKADLVSQMVGEFPELQGVMGQHYARHSGEPEAVAVAIAEHYLPRGAQDVLPQTLIGQVVGLADRLDTLVGIFSLGELPSGSSDPFALRRAANAVVSIIWAAHLPLQLGSLISGAVAHLGEDAALAVSDPPRLIQQLQDFFRQRVQTLLQEEGVDYDLVNAVLGEADSPYGQRVLTDLLETRSRAQFLQEIRRDGRLQAVYETVNRATRLAAQGDLPTDLLAAAGLVDPDQFESPAEAALLAALTRLLPQTQAALAQGDYQQLVAGLTQVASVVSNFFDGPDSVLVMAADPQVRRNRLTLLGLLRNHALVLADFGAIVKE
ncbi:MAG: glycine--tRNA ligase subunit beta [Cyanobacteria bacterium REEB459]|nr:glycine--tRNA ligase subunit beta [Cyanobacteria bacterium REEB459]